jgi:hypothetical protein
MNTRAYLFHGLRLRVSGGKAVLANLHARLGRFPEQTHHGAADLQFEFHHVGDASHHTVARPAGVGRSVLEPGLGELVYFDQTQLLYLEIPGHGRALCDARSGRVQVSYPRAAGKDLWLLSHPLFTIPLAELLKRRGLYMLHAAGLAVAGKGLLVAGQSGAGKTTLALALLRAGFDFLADDTVFLSREGKQLRILAFPDEVDVTAETLEFFPELRPLAQSSKPKGRPKRAFCTTRFYGVAPRWECVPGTIVFPKPAGLGMSVITPMPKAEALMQLVCNVLRTDPHSSQSHLDALADLVRDSRCFRLQTGCDFDQLPALLRSVMSTPPLPFLELQC